MSDDDVESMRAFSLNLTNPSPDAQLHNTALLTQLSTWPPSIPILLRLITEPTAACGSPSSSCGSPASSSSPPSASASTFTVQTGCSMILKRICDIQYQLDLENNNNNKRRGADISMAVPLSPMKLAARDAANNFEEALFMTLSQQQSYSTSLHHSASVRFQQVLSAAIASLLRWLTVEEWRSWEPLLANAAQNFAARLSTISNAQDPQFSHLCQTYFVVCRCLRALFEQAGSQQDLSSWNSLTISCGNTVALLLQQFSVLYPLCVSADDAQHPQSSTILLVGMLTEVLHVVVAMFVHGVIAPSEFALDLFYSSDDDDDEDAVEMHHADVDVQKLRAREMMMVVGKSPNKSAREASKQARQERAAHLAATKSQNAAFVQLVAQVLSSTMQVGEELFGALHGATQQRLMLVTLELTTHLIAYWSVTSGYVANTLPVVLRLVGAVGVDTDDNRPLSVAATELLTELAQCTEAHSVLDPHLASIFESLITASMLTNEDVAELFFGGDSSPDNWRTPDALGDLHLGNLSGRSSQRSAGHSGGAGVEEEEENRDLMEAATTHGEDDGQEDPGNVRSSLSWCISSFAVSYHDSIVTAVVPVLTHKLLRSIQEKNPFVLEATMFVFAELADELFVRIPASIITQMTSLMMGLVQPRTYHGPFAEEVAAFATLAVLRLQAVRVLERLCTGFLGALKQQHDEERDDSDDDDADIRQSEMGSIHIPSVVQLFLSVLSTEEHLERNKTVQFRVIRALENIFSLSLNDDEEDDEEDAGEEGESRFAVRADDLHGLYSLVVASAAPLSPFDTLLQDRCRLALLACLSRVLPLDGSTLRVCIAAAPTLIQHLLARVHHLCSSSQTLADVYWRPGGVVLFRLLDVLCTEVESIGEVVDEESVFPDDVSRRPLAELLQQVWGTMGQLLDFGYASLEDLAKATVSASAVVGLGIFVEDVVTLSLDVVSAIADVLQSAVLFGEQSGSYIVTELFAASTIVERTVSLLHAHFHAVWQAPSTLICSAFGILADFSSLYHPAGGLANHMDPTVLNRIAWYACECIVRRRAQQQDVPGVAVVVNDAEQDAVVSNALYCVGKLFERAIALCNASAAANVSSPSTENSELYRAVSTYIPSVLELVEGSSASSSDASLRKMDVLLLSSVELLTSTLGEIRETARDNAQIVLALFMRYDPHLTLHVLTSSSSSSSSPHLRQSNHYTTSSSDLVQLWSALGRQIAKQAASDELVGLLSHISSFLGFLAEAKGVGKWVQDSAVPLAKLSSAAYRAGRELDMSDEAFTSFVAPWRQVAACIVQFKKPTRKNFVGMSGKELEGFVALL